MQRTLAQIDITRDEHDFYESLLELDGKSILELGCGAAALTRRIASEGSDRQIIATEVDEQAHATNLTIDDLPNVRFLLAGAEAIPLEDASVDRVFMFKSLHHVPLELMDKVFDELQRVVRPGGKVWISEPIFAGDFNEVLRLFHDEQAVRQAAFDATCRAVEAGKLSLVEQHFFNAEMRFSDFADFRQRIISVTHTQHRLSDELLAQVEAKFKQSMGPDGARFLMPMRIDLLQR